MGKAGKEFDYANPMKHFGKPEKVVYLASSYFPIQLISLTVQLFRLYFPSI
ncbi:hypothetical protein ACTWP4_04020 [Gracilibacillus sp. D59]|uniref:hypothetical protein n=1 Tax=Gracilibacillus sp. D59 TaxID=3457434 RepID=UPI003FCCB4FA